MISQTKNLMVYTIPNRPSTLLLPRGAKVSETDSFLWYSTRVIFGASFIHIAYINDFERSLSNSFQICMLITFMLLGKNKQLCKISEIGNIKVNSKEITRVNKTKYLGLTIKYLGLTRGSITKYWESLLEPTIWNSKGGAKMWTPLFFVNYY